MHFISNVFFPLCFSPVSPSSVFAVNNTVFLPNFSSLFLVYKAIKKSILISLFASPYLHQVLILGLVPFELPNQLILHQFLILDMITVEFSKQFRINPTQLQLFSGRPGGGARPPENAKPPIVLCLPSSASSWRPRRFWPVQRTALLGFATLGVLVRNRVVPGLLRLQRN